GSAAEDVKSLEELAGASLSVDYTLPGWFLWHAPEDLVGPGWPPLRPARVHERTREAALQAARRIDPHVEEAQIVPAELDTIFSYLRRDSNTLHVNWTRRGGHWGRAVSPHGR